MPTVISSGGALNGNLIVGYDEIVSDITVEQNIFWFGIYSYLYVSSGGTANGTTKDLLLEQGTYYLSMESTNAKKGGSGDFTVSYGERTHFFEADDKDDNAITGAEVAVFGGEWGDWVGMGDAIDYSALQLDGATRLSLNVNATDAAKFTVWTLDDTTGKTKFLQGTTLKLDKGTGEYGATTKDLLLEAGTYYLSMESTNAKKGGSAEFTVSYGERAHFFEVDDKDDNAIVGNEVADFDGEWADWVGMGDVIDYARLDLSEAAARVAFDVTSTDAGKFTVWSVDAKTGKLKSVQASTLKPDKASGDYAVTTKSLMLAQGTYYLSMESSNAKKGGSADFTVAYTDDCRLFNDGDNGNDTWQAAAENDVLAIGDNASGWVGFDDASDYYAFQVDEAGKLSLTFDEATEAAVKAKQLKLSCLDAKGKAVSLAALKDGSVDSSKVLSEGTYYLGVTCANTQKYETNYNINLGMSYVHVQRVIVAVKMTFEAITTVTDWHPSRFL
ncbi:MAG: hypothetical protein IJS08_10785, partial [Victivallales bacterium]|nr:hypothetical protein [Victivallales bacterium]